MTFTQMWQFLTSFLPPWFAIACLAIIAFLLILIIFKLVALIWDILPFV